MRVKKLPMILALHLKRFKYVEQYNRHIKVSHRVVFPLELRLFNTVNITKNLRCACYLISLSLSLLFVNIKKKQNFQLQSDDAVNPDRLYDLVAVVIHCGSGPNRGHYISIVKSHGFWLLFDDDMVDVRFMQKLFIHLSNTLRKYILVKNKIYTFTTLAMDIFISQLYHIFLEN